jgi:hypothetical protein
MQERITVGMTEQSLFKGDINPAEPQTSVFHEPVLIVTYSDSVHFILL